MRVEGSYNRQLAADLVKRVAPPSQPYASADLLGLVRYDPGDETSFAIRPFFRLAKSLAIIGSAERWHHGSDGYSYAEGADPVPGVDAAVLGEESDASATLWRYYSTGAPETTLEDVLEAFIRPALDLSHDDSGALFMRVLARAFAEHDDTLRQFLSANYGHVMRQFTAEFARLLPQLSKEELYWRIDLVTGALTHAMSGFGMIQRKSDVSEHTHREQTAQHLIRFAVAGLSHP